NDILSSLTAGNVQVLGGTFWLWAREDAFESVDYLFIDEASQASLANALAVAQSTNNLVLLGDPQQLEQPIQGAHPEGADASALSHILGDHQTIPADRGLFLAETWRLPPSVSGFTSEIFYEGRLRSRPGLENQRLSGPTQFTGSGLWFLPVEHDG